MSISIKNSTNVPIDGNGVWTGQVEDVTAWSAVGVGVLTDKDGEMGVQFSTDGSHWDYTNTLSVSAGVASYKSCYVPAKNLRVKFENLDASAQTFIRLQTSLKGSAQNMYQAGSWDVTVLP